MLYVMLHGLVGIPSGSLRGRGDMLYDVLYEHDLGHMPYDMLYEPGRSAIVYATLAGRCAI